MSALYVVIAIAAGFLFVSLAACVRALLWSTRAVLRRPVASLILSILALALSYLGMTRFRITYSKTVNGSGWTVDSKWFFLLPLILGILSLVLAIRNLANTSSKSADRRA